jgi:hypothetical protein
MSSYFTSRLWRANGITRNVKLQSPRRSQRHAGVAAQRRIWPVRNDSRSRLLQS